MITLHKESRDKGFTFRLGNHTGACFNATTKKDFLENFDKFKMDFNVSPYPKSASDFVLSEQSKKIIDAYE